MVRLDRDEISAIVMTTTKHDIPKSHMKDTSQSLASLTYSLHFSSP